MFHENESAVLAQGLFDIREEIYPLWTLECQESVLTCPGPNCPFLFTSSIVGRLKTYNVIRITHSELQKEIPSCSISRTVSLKELMTSFSANIQFGGKASVCGLLTKGLQVEHLTVCFIDRSSIPCSTNFACSFFSINRARPHDYTSLHFQQYYYTVLLVQKQSKHRCEHRQVFLCHKFIWKFENTERVL